MNKRQKAALKAIGTGAAFAVSMGDLIDNFAKTSNHPSWYTHYPTESLVTLNFGMRENKFISSTSDMANHSLGSITRLNGTTPLASYLSPTDAVINVHLAIPTANKGQDPMDKAAALVLQQIRSVATTTAPYDKGDVRRLLLNARSIVAAYAVLRRVSGEFEITDTYDADAYYKYVCMGLDGAYSYAAIAQNIAQFRAELAALTPLIRNLIPVNIDVMERTKWMFSNIFADSPSAKFSTKQFACMEFPMIAEDDTNHLFCLSPSSSVLRVYSGEGTEDNPFKPAAADPRVHRPTLFSDMVGIVREMISFFTNQSKVSRILGDVLKAFGQKAFMDFPEFQPHARTPVVYDEDILQQIQNATTLPSASYQLDMPKQGMVTLLPAVGTAHLTTHLVNTYRDSVPVGKLLSLTRLSAFSETEDGYHYDSGTQPGTKMEVKMEVVTSCGTEFVTDIRYLLATGPGEACIMLDWYTVVSDASVADMAELVMAWTQDDYAPLMLIEKDSGIVRTLFDAQNWALMGARDADAYHEYASLSLFMIHELVQKSDTFVFVQ